MSPNAAVDAATAIHRPTTRGQTAMILAMQKTRATSSKAATPTHNTGPNQTSASHGFSMSPTTSRQPSGLRCGATRRVRTGCATNEKTMKAMANAAPAAVSRSSEPGWRFRADSGSRHTYLSRTSIETRLAVPTSSG